MMTTSIIQLDPAKAVEQATNKKDVIAALYRGREDRAPVLAKDVDYGVIPGTNKPTLLKPGAEHICSAFGLRPRFEAISIVENWDRPLFHYRYRCELIHIESGLIVGEGIGSCNSMEDKYAYRWVKEHEVPKALDKNILETRASVISEFKFAVEKKETTGEYGKPAAYWQAFEDAIEDGMATLIKKRTAKGAEYDAWEIRTELYRIPNQDIFSLVNTLDKMSQKRALIAAVLVATGASEFFTQDVEDLRGFGYIDEDAVTVPVQDAPPANVDMATGEVKESRRVVHDNGNGDTPRRVGTKATMPPSVGDDVELPEWLYPSRFGVLMGLPKLRAKDAYGTDTVGLANAIKGMVKSGLLSADMTDDAITDMLLEARQDSLKPAAGQ